MSALIFYFYNVGMLMLTPVTGIAAGRYVGLTSQKKEALIYSFKNYTISTVGLLSFFE